MVLIRPEGFKVKDTTTSPQHKSDISWDITFHQNRFINECARMILA